MTGTRSRGRSGWTSCQGGVMVPTLGVGAGFGDVVHRPICRPGKILVTIPNQPTMYRVKPHGSPGPPSRRSVGFVTCAHQSPPRCRATHADGGVHTRIPAD